MAAPALLDFVLETATNPGTGTFTLNGAVADRRSFASAAPAGGSVFYVADDGTQSEWGIGTVSVGSPNTLGRAQVLGNTLNTTATLNFNGTVRVYSSLPASCVPILDASGDLSLPGDLSAQDGTFRSLSVSDNPDWSSRQVVPAAAADARYLRLYSDTGGKVINAIDLTTATNQVSARDSDGNWHALQPAGDYATSTNLTDEIKDRKNADTTLQDSINGKVSVAGDTMTGSLTLIGNSPSTTSGDQNIGPSLITGYNGRGKVSIRQEETVDSYVQLALLLTWNGQYKTYFNFREDGRVYSPQGVCALTSELPMDASLKVLAFTIPSVSFVNGGTLVNFPSAFSGTPLAVVANTSSDGDMDVWTYGWSATQFRVNIPSNSNTSNQTVSIIAVGPK